MSAAAPTRRRHHHHHHHFGHVFYYSTWFNPGVYLAILFYQPGNKIGQFFLPGW